MKFGRPCLCREVIIIKARGGVVNNLFFTFFLEMRYAL